MSTVLLRYDNLKSPSPLYVHLRNFSKPNAAMATMADAAKQVPTYTIMPSYLPPPTKKPKSALWELPTFFAWNKAVDMGVERTLPRPRVSSRKPRRFVDNIGSSSAIQEFSIVRLVTKKVTLTSYWSYNSGEQT